MKHWIKTTFFLLFFAHVLVGQHSVARQWNEILLQGIRGDFARPTVHARNLFHSSVAMYDAWALYDSIARPYFMGNTIDDYNFEFEGMPSVIDVESSREEAISHAMYRLLRHRFLTSPGAWELYLATDSLITHLGFDKNNTSLDYRSGDPAALGNFIADHIIKFGLNDGANEIQGYENLYYETANPPLIMDRSGNPGIEDPNKWQSLTLDVFIDQSGNVIPLNTPEFLSPEWGNVTPFALDESVLSRYENEWGYWNVYHDPGHPWYIQDGMGIDDPYKWGFALVSVWSSHLGVKNDTLIDISPGSIGNNMQLPANFEEYKDFYNFEKGGDNSPGHLINPVTGQSYEPNLVKRSDYGRVLAEFWADGPDSETPPGHWFTILNYVNDSPLLEKRFEGKGEVVDDLEWDVKTYLALGGAMHDCAVTAWGIKGFYDYIRPVSAIRYMATKGQSSSQNLPNYHPHGMPLVDGYIELVMPGDPLAGIQGENTNEVKILAWKGPDFIQDPENSLADVDWILAKDWWPYQRPSFVTPPFAGYVSGHSTFSRAAADILARITGDEYFPGGLAEFQAAKNEFLVFEDGPSEDIVLQWATYRDASDQTSLSRIWGGIHPPVDDIPGRKIGIQIAEECFQKAREYFYVDADNDGFYNYEDCDDRNAASYPGAVEICDGLDNNCDGLIDEDLEIFTYYLDSDDDGYGTLEQSIDTCVNTPPVGYSTMAFDCDDLSADSYPRAEEVCDGKDNDCDGYIDEGLTLYTYYLDSDGDGFGDANVSLDTCINVPPINFVIDDTDCNDFEAGVNPGVIDLLDNDIDEDCSGRDASSSAFYINNLNTGEFILHYPEPINAEMRVYAVDGRLMLLKNLDFTDHYQELDMRNLGTGIYILILISESGERLFSEKVIMTF
ncbi:MopE-related protein [Portibacter marinus]|uniref:MopE-related protein n=1 Tax=Portibacter marinus TaxID=2898660 RepID=UPI001F3EE6A5|nr:MopE-related protein [Portibacter marinus]